MPKKTSLLLSLIFSLFFISSCHHIGKKACCGKKSKSSYHHHHKKGKKACCGKRARYDQKKGKKACCGKRSWFKKGKKWKKDCCGKASSVAGHAIVNAVQGNALSGEVWFEKSDWHKVKVTANFTGLKANQKFGFHVHEFGNCKNKALMAGGHLNPRGQKHGGPLAKERHLGDLGNLVSDAEGKAAYSAVIHGRVKKFLGRSVIVHAQPDDLKSQPTGNAGSRIACGVITAAMPPSPEKATEDKTAPPTPKAPEQKATSAPVKAVAPAKAQSADTATAPAKPAPKANTESQKAK